MVNKVERLQKIMARAGVASRRRSEELILHGHVRVDGRVVREMGLKVDPLVNEIEVSGKVIKPQSPREYIILNKPTGYITTVIDPYKRPTVMDLVGGPDIGLYPVGRLDQNTSGLLLFTNDGDLAFHLTHPKYKVAKVYEVMVRGTPSPDDIWKLRNGIMLENSKTRPAKVRIKERRERTTLMELTIFEGKKRQIRRMCLAIGHPVAELKRLSIGPLKLGGLEAGHWRRLTKNEEVLLKDAVSE